MLTGTYRKVRDNTVAEVRVSDGKLMFDRLTLIPVGPAAFSSSANKFLFQERHLERAVDAGGGLFNSPVDRAEVSVDSNLNSLQFRTIAGWNADNLRWRLRLRNTFSAVAETC
jgi:hypothetical protein